MKELKMMEINTQQESGIVTQSEERGAIIEKSV